MKEIFKFRKNKKIKNKIGKITFTKIKVKTILIGSFLFIGKNSFDNSRSYYLSGI